MDVNWNAVYGFWLVAEHGSFAEAARALPRGSVQALHKRVRQLEEADNLNVKLFRSRGVKGVELTDAGRRLHDLLSTVFRSFDEMAAELRGEDEGTLRLGVSAYAAFNYREKFVATFYRAFPKVSLRVREHNSLEIINLLETGQLDVGVCSPLSGQRHLQVAGRRRMKLEILSSPKDRLAKRPATWREVLKKPIILFERTSVIRRSFDALLSHEKLFSELRVAAEVPTSEFAIDAVRAGLGVALVPAGPKLRQYSAGLHRSSLPPGLRGFDFGVLYRRDRYLPRYMRELIHSAAKIIRS